jgi:hypothetical protein
LSKTWSLWLFVNVFFLKWGLLSEASYCMFSMWVELWRFWYSIPPANPYFSDVCNSHINLAYIFICIHMYVYV